MCLVSTILIGKHNIVCGRVSTCVYVFFCLYVCAHMPLNVSSFLYACVKLQLCACARRVRVCRLSHVCLYACVCVWVCEVCVCEVYVCRFIGMCYLEFRPYACVRLCMCVSEWVMCMWGVCVREVCEVCVWGSVWGVYVSCVYEVRAMCVCQLADVFS